VIYLLYTVHVLVCVFLILVVLLQQGKGADLSVFGGGSTQTAFGARGATTFLHKLTVFSFIVFVLTTLAIGIPQFGGTASVMRGGGAARKPATAPAGTPGGKAAPGGRPAPAPARPGVPGAPAQAPKAPPPAPAPNPGKPR
jgi:preprotein translocase subunit SecG